MRMQICEQETFSATCVLLAMVACCAALRPVAEESGTSNSSLTRGLSLRFPPQVEMMRGGKLRDTHVCASGGGGGGGGGGVTFVRRIVSNAN